MHAAHVHYQILTVFQNFLIFVSFIQLGQCRAKKAISLLITVLEFIGLKHQNCSRQIVKYLYECISRLLGLLLHHEERRQHVPHKIGLCQHQE